MKCKRVFFLMAVLIWSVCTTCRAGAQSLYDQTNPLQILTFHDSSNGGVCIPMKAVDNDSDLQKYGGGCCAAPGRRGCMDTPSAHTTYPVCFNVDPMLLNDPYGSGQLCMLPEVQPDPAIPMLGKDGQETTFYVTSDLHFFRRTFELTDQLKHVQELKNFTARKLAWPTGTGIPANTPVPDPIAVIVDGDLTTYGAADNLGAYRISWERGTLPDSIQYPVLFGLGNHEIVSDETPENAHRMFDYLSERMANMNVDPDSGNYSWDWNGVHYVQQNAWAGDQTSLYFNCGGQSGTARCSDGLAWLANDLALHVGNTTKPVVLFQHYRFGDVNTSKSISVSDDDYWPTDENAINAGGGKTGQGYQTWYNIVKNYNVIGLFGGHDHCLGVSSSILVKLPITGPTYPGVQGYGVPIDNFDDGSGGDTRGTDAEDPGQESAGIGNPCAATVVDGKTIPQTAVASFLVSHITPHYLDVAAVSWNDNASAPYFDDAEGMPTGSSTCHKRINSQFVPTTAGITVETVLGGYTVQSAMGTPPDIPVALRFSTKSGVTNFSFVDNCGDPQNTGANNAYFLVNGEQGLAPGVNYRVKVSMAAGAASATPAITLLTPLSGVSVPYLRHHFSLTRLAKSSTIDPVFDTFTVYGPPGAGFSETTHYTGAESGWLYIRPISDNFDSAGQLTFIVHYKVPAQWLLTGSGKSSAEIQVTSGGTNVIQTVKTDLWY